MKKFHSLLILLLWSSGFLLAQQSPDCEENVDATQNTEIVSNTLQASNTLTVNRKLNSGDTLRLIGGQLIELLPGFEADEGSYVEGENGECIQLVDKAPPVMLSYLFDRTDEEGTFLILPVSGVDGAGYPNGITYSATDLPPGLSIDAGTGSIQGVIATGSTRTEPYQVKITLQDRIFPELKTTDGFYWYITDSGQNAKSDPTKSGEECRNFNISCVPLPIGNTFGGLSVEVKSSPIGNAQDCPIDDYTYEWYIGDIGESDASQLTPINTESECKDENGNVIPCPSNQLSLANQDEGHYSVVVTDSDGNQKTCSAYVSSTINTCENSCQRLGEDLPVGDNFCYQWTAVGNRNVNPDGTDRKEGVEVIPQEPDAFEEIPEENGRVVRVCPSFPQYYDVIVTDGLNIIQEKQYYTETNEDRVTLEDQEKPSLGVEIKIDGIICSTGNTESTATLTADAGSGTNYTYKWDTPNSRPETSDGEQEPEPTTSPIDADNLGLYVVTVTDEDTGCTGVATALPPVCDEDVEDPTIYLAECVLNNFALRENGAHCPDCGDVDDYAGLTPEALTALQEAASNFSYNPNDPNAVGLNVRYIVSKSDECPPDEGCDAKTQFEAGPQGDTDILYWIVYDEETGTADMKVKFRDGFFDINPEDEDKDDRTEEQKAIDEKELKLAFLAGIQAMYECDKNENDENCAASIEKRYEADMASNQMPDDQVCEEDCATCIARCLTPNELTPRGAMGVRIGGADCNQWTWSNELGMLWQSLKKKKEIPPNMWEHEGQSIFYMYPAMAGLVDAVLQENPVTGLIEIGKLLANPKTWETIGNTFVHPVEAMHQFVEFAKKAYGGIVKGIADLEDKLCGRHGCDAMLHAQAKLVGVIGMLVADFATGGFGVSKLPRLVTGGAKEIFGALSSWKNRLNRLPVGVRDRYHRTIQEVLSCPIPLTSDVVADKSNTEACDLLRKYNEDFAKLSPADWDKIFNNPSLIRTWKLMQPKSILDVLGKFPDPKQYPDFYKKFNEVFFNKLDDGFISGIKDSNALKSFMDDLSADPNFINTFIKNPELIGIYSELYLLNAHPDLLKDPKFLQDFYDSSIKLRPAHIPSGPMVGKEIGHTFDKHGSHNTKQLLYQAIRGNGTPQGQWLDDIAAENFIARHLDQLGVKKIDIPLPPLARKIGRVFKAGTGEIVEATHIRLIRDGNGVETAFPINKFTWPLCPNVGTYVP